MAEADNYYDKDTRDHHSRRTRPTQESYRPPYSDRGRGRQDSHIAKALYNFGVTDLRELLNKKHSQEEQERSKFLNRRSKSNERQPYLSKPQTRSKSIEKQVASKKPPTFLKNPSNIRVELSTITGQRNCIIDEDITLANIRHVSDDQFYLMTREKGITNRYRGGWRGRGSFGGGNEKPERGSEYQLRGRAQLERGCEQWERGGVQQERGSEQHGRDKEQQRRGGEQQRRGGEQRGRGSEQRGRDGERRERGGERRERGGERRERGGERRERRGEQSGRGGELRGRGGGQRGRGGEQWGRDQQWGKGGEQWGKGGEQWGRGGEQWGRGGEQWGIGGEQWGRAGEQRGRGGEQQGTGGERQRRGAEQWERGGEQHERGDEQWARHKEMLQKSEVLRRNEPNNRGGAMRGDSRGRKGRYRGAGRGYHNRLEHSRIPSRDKLVENETNTAIQTDENWDHECADLPIQDIPIVEDKQLVDNSIDNEYYSDDEYSVGRYDPNIDNLVTKINDNLVITTNVHEENEKITVMFDKGSLTPINQDLEEDTHHLEGGLKTYDTRIQEETCSSDSENLQEIVGETDLSEGGFKKDIAGVIKSSN